jgi:hypothetical protein
VQKRRALGFPSHAQQPRHQLASDRAATTATGPTGRRATSGRRRQPARERPPAARAR